MRLKCILINPWIYDFAAVNMWARPLGLLKVAEQLSRFDMDQKLIDCTAPFRERMYGMGSYPRQVIEKPAVLKAVPRYYARYGIGIDEFRKQFKKHLPCDFILVTSIMSYWYPGAHEVIRIVKSLSPETPVILGGIYATLHHKHAVENSGADYVYKGHVEEIRSNEGGVFDPPLWKRGGRGDFISTLLSDKNLQTIIESFGCKLEKTHPPKPYYTLGLYQEYPFAPVHTSYGCPYKCSYCASSILFEGFLQREPSDVIREINDLYDMGVRDYAFYDDALLVNADSRLKIILQEVIQSGRKVRFHCPNGIHARFIDDEIAHLMKQSGFTTLRLGFETVNEERQLTTGGKVTTESFKTAIRALKRHGFTKEHIGAYLMYGLPGQKIDEVKVGVAFLKGLGVRIHLTEFSPIPGTACWDELKGKGIITDDLDPLLTNNTVFAYLFSGYDHDAIKALKLEVKEYNSCY
jgi:radical SAM superfamily enzyme YgiQ (UPF0313 family)